MILAMGGVSCSDAVNSGILWKHGLGSGRLDWWPGLASLFVFVVDSNQPVNHPNPLLITFFTDTKLLAHSYVPLPGRIRYDLPVPYNLPRQETYL